MYKSRFSKVASVIGMFAIVAASFAFALTTAKASQYDYEWVSQSGYPTIAQGGSTVVNLAIKNTGSATWYNNGSNPVRLGTVRPMDRNSGFYKSMQWISTNRAAALNEATVAPGQIGTFTFIAEGNPAPGTYPEYFAPVVENLTWMADKGIYWDMTVSSGPVSTEYSAEVVSKTGDVSVKAGETATLNLTVKNTGTATWSNAGAYPIHVGTWNPVDRSSDFYDSSWLATNRPDGLNESSVAPGAQGTFEFKINVPSNKSNGTYTENFNLVAEGKTWFNVPFSYKVTVTDNPVHGDITVSLASDTPAGTTIPKGANGVELAKYKFTGTGTLNSLKLNRFGVGSASAFDNVYLYEGDKRLTNGRSVSSSTQIVEFNNLNWAVNGTKYLTVVADFNTSATGQHGFQIQSSSDVSINGVNGSFPIKGELFAVGDENVSTVVLDRQSNPANPNVGEHAELAKFKITNGSNDTKFYQITLLQTGTISNSDLTDLELYQGSTKIASADKLEGDKAIFVLGTPYEMTNGTSRIFTVKGTTAGRADRTVKFYLEYTTDLQIIDKVYGYGAQITNNFNSNNPSEVDLQGGNITISYNGPTTGDIAKNGQDQNMLNFAISSASRQTEVKKISVKLDGVGGDKLDDNGTDLFTDIKIRETDSAYTASIQSAGSTLMGPKSLCTGNDIVTCTLNFTDSFYINAGETKYLQLTWDVANNAYFDGGIRDYTATINAWDNSSMRYTDTSEYVNTSDIVPSSAYTGNQQTVKVSTLTNSLSGEVASDTVVTGQSNVKTVAFNFTAGSRPVTIDGVKLHSWVNVTGAWSNNGRDAGGVYIKDIVTSVKLMDGSTQVGTSQNITTDGIVNFSSLNVLVPANNAKTLTAVINISSSAPYTNPENYVSLYIANNTDISATDDDGNTITPVGTVNTNPATGVVTTITTNGTLSLVEEGSRPQSAIILAGTSKVEVAKFRFEATKEAFRIEKMRVQVGNAALDADAVSNVYLNFGGSDITASSSDLTSGGTNYAQFEGMNAEVPRDGSLIVTVKVDLKSISGANSSSIYSGRFIKITSLDATNTYFRAVGKASGRVLTFYNVAAGSNPTANIMQVRKTKPTVAKVSSSTNKLLNGNNEVYRFTVSADNKGPVDFYGITLNASPSGVTTSQYVLYDVTTSSKTALSNPTDPVGTLVTLNATQTNNTQEIGAGSTKTYSVECTVAGANADGDSLDVYINKDTNNMTKDTAGNLIAVPRNFIWSDESGTTTNIHTSANSFTGQAGVADYINGWYVTGLPMDHQLLSWN